MKTIKKWFHPVVQKFGSDAGLYKTASSEESGQVVNTNPIYPKHGSVCGDSLLRYTGQCKIRNGAKCENLQYGPECLTRNGQPCK